MKIEIELSTRSIENAIKEIEKYQKNLMEKVRMFNKRLADEGISIAQGKVGSFGKYILFSQDTERIENGYRTVLYATNTGIITSKWRTKDGVKSADISPLFMVEFGSGLRAQNPKGIPGGGTGTFPGSNHSDDPSGWWYMDLDYKWHHSTGVTPRLPMYNAAMAMRAKIVTIAKEVFNSD